MNKKIFTGKCSAKICIASCILLAAGSATAAENMQTQFAPATPQRHTLQDTKTAPVTRAALPVSTSMSRSTAQVTPATVTPTIPTVGTGMVAIDPAVIKAAVDQKILQMMEGTMKDNMTGVGTGVMQEMRMKAMTESMNSNLMQDSMRPAIMGNMRNSMQEGVKGENK
jgi:hypothetical protein